MNNEVSDLSHTNNNQKYTNSQKTISAGRESEGGEYLGVGTEWYIA